MLKKLRKRLSKIIYSTANSMSLPNQFLRGGRKYMHQDWTEVVIDDHDLYSGYNYAAIRNRANYVAQIAAENIRTESQMDDYVHPYLAAISKSKTFADNKFWTDISTYLDLEGVYYLLAIRNYKEGGKTFGKVNEFKLLSPYNIRRVLKPDTLEVQGYIETRLGMVRELPPEMIIEIRELNPFDENSPFAMTDAGKESQFTIKTAKDYTRHALKHNINAPGILNTDVILEEEEFKNFTERVKNHVKGEPIFGNGKGTITWDSMAMELSKAALGEVNDQNRDELFAVSGMSKTMMGIEQSGTTRETSRVQKDLLIENHILPRIKMITDALNQDYKNKYPDEFEMTEATIVCDNPLATDHDADLKKTEVSSDRAELYDGLLAKGYDPEKVALYVKGEIDVDMLGVPNRPQPVTPLLPDDQSDNHLHTHVQPALYVKKNATNQQEQSGLITQQEGALKNAITNIEQSMVANAIVRVERVTNQFEDESELVTKTEKKDYINELEAVLVAFMGLILSLRGGDVMRDRMSEFALTGIFKMDKDVKKWIKDTANKVATSHVDTVSKDIWETARKAALEGKGQREIINDIKEKYSQVISETRAKTIARTETNRAFTRAQYEADVQFLDQNDLGERAFKRWRTRSDDPCPFCRSLEAEGLIPFNESFRDLGDDITVDDKKLPVNFEAIRAGNAHPNCSCIYELVILDE